jgi:hypothetical protein
LIAICAALAGCASGGGRESGAMGSSASAGSTGSATDLAAMLSGRFQAEGQGNDATLDIGSTGGLSGRVFNLFASTRGQIDGRAVSEQGVIHLEYEGRDVAVSYIPHFDPTKSELSQDAASFSASELRSACTFYLVPWESGWAGQTSGSATCVRALGGGAGTWRFEVQPDTIRVIRPGPRGSQGESTVFRRVTG